MKRFLVAAGCLGILLAAVVYATDVPRVVAPRMASQLTGEEIERLTVMIREAYPAALERVVAFIGTDRARRAFPNFTVSLAWNPPVGETWYGISSYRQRRSRIQSVRIYATRHLTGTKNIEETLAHLMFFVALEYRNSFSNLQDIPGYLDQGLAEMASGDYRDRIVAVLNSRTPVFDAEPLMTGEDYGELRERSFGYCFQRHYGEEALRRLVLDMFRGRKWRRSVERAAGEDWRTVKRNCRACLETYLNELIESDPSFREVHRAYEEEDWQRVIELGTEHIAAHPESVWRIRGHWELARALARRGRYAEAIETYETIRTGGCGPTPLDDNAARRIVKAYARSGDCETARRLRREFTRLYPAFRIDWHDDLREFFETRCPGDGD